MTTKKVVTYLRISTANQIDNTSIETQREKINLYCKLNDINIIKEFKDEAISAKHEHTREDYQKLIKFIADKENKIDAIVAKEIWSIAAKSPEYGNALMDVLGEEIYNKVMILQREA